MKIFMSLLLIIISTIFIYMIRPISEIDWNLFQQDLIIKEISNTERLIYAYRLKIKFNETLYKDIHWTSLRTEPDFCSNLCFISYYEVLRSAEHKISNEQLGMNILSLKDMVKNEEEKQKLTQFYNSLLNEQKQKEIYCDYYKYDEKPPQNYNPDCKGVIK